MSRTRLITAFAGLVFCSLTLAAPAPAHGGETTVLPDGQCLFADGHIGACDDPAITTLVDADNPVSSEEAPVPVGADGEAVPMTTSIEPERSLDVTVPLPTVDGATATVDPTSSSGSSLPLTAVVVTIATGVVLYMRRRR